MRRLRLVLSAGAVVAMAMVAYAVPAMAQTSQEVAEAERLLRTAERFGIEVPSDPDARVQLAAQYGITISPEAAAAADQPGAKGGDSQAEKKAERKAERKAEKTAEKTTVGSKELPKSGGANTALLLALGIGVTLVGGGIVVHKSRARGRG